MHIMPKRKSKNLETIDELVQGLQNAEAEIKDAIDDIKNETTEDKPKVGTSGDDTDSKRQELIQCSEDGEISQKAKYLLKASAKAINKLYTELTAKRMQKTNEYLTEVLIARFSSILQSFDAADFVLTLKLTTWPLSENKRRIANPLFIIQSTKPGSVYRLQALTHHQTCRPHRSRLNYTYVC